MVALPNAEDLKRLPQVPEKGRLRALVFKADEGSVNDFRQVECIFAALRALYRGDTDAIKALYKLASGEEFSGNVAEILANLDNPAALAAKIKFNLKSIPIENDEMRERLNNRAIDLIREAA